MCDKVKYPNFTQAYNVAERAKLKCRAYRCEVCKAIHLTSGSLHHKKKKGNMRRKRQ